MKKMLEAVDDLSFRNLYLLSPIRDAIEERISWLEDREPESDGAVHDEWEEKIDALDEILEEIDNVENAVNDLLDDIKELISDYQLTYGGLSRLKIEIRGDK